RRRDLHGSARGPRSRALRRTEQLAARSPRKPAARAPRDRRARQSETMKKAAAKRRGSPAIERARRVLEIEADAVRALVDRVGPDLERAVELLAQTAGKVIVTGLGKSGIIARKIAATLASTGTPAFFVHAGEGVHGDLGMVVKGDSVIAVS